MKRIITEKLKYITYQYKKAGNLGKMYLLPKIHNRLSNVVGRVVSSKCVMPSEKVSEVLDYHLKPQNSKLCIGGSGHFLEKI